MFLLVACSNSGAQLPETQITKHDTTKQYTHVLYLGLPKAVRKICINVFVHWLCSQKVLHKKVIGVHKKCSCFQWEPLLLFSPCHDSTTKQSLLQTLSNQQQ